MDVGEITLAVDTYSIVFRAHHALPPMHTKRGEPTSALYGFSSVLLKELRERAPVQLAFAIDAPLGTFRHERLASYKATRDATPAPLVAQLGRLRELLEAFGAPVFEVPGVEADDVLASIAAEFARRSQPLLILSGDRDLLQTARGSVSVLFVGARAQKPRIYGVTQVVERFGVAPEQLPSWVALVGDVSDNLPGVPGVGPRTAARWVRQFGGIRDLLADLDRAEPARLRPKLLEWSERLLLHEELATLRRDVPLGNGPLAAPLTLAAVSRLRSIFLDLEFASLVPRLEALAERIRA